MHGPPDRISPWHQEWKKAVFRASGTAIKCASRERKTNNSNPVDVRNLSGEKIRNSSKKRFVFARGTAFQRPERTLVPQPSSYLVNLGMPLRVFLFGALYDRE